MRIDNHTNTDQLQAVHGKRCQIIRQLDETEVDCESWPMFRVSVDGNDGVDVFLDELEPQPTDWTPHSAA